MSNFGDHPAGFFGDSSFYNGVATQSVRLAGDSSLTRANADAGTSTKIATISCWFKRTELSVLAYLLHSKNDSGGASFGITLDADDSITVTQYDGTSPFNANNYDFGVTVDPRKFRDTSAWYHLVVDIDTTEAAEADRIKIYINGTRQTVVATTDGSGLQDFADEDQTLAIFQDGDIRWGGTVDDSAYAHIYLAECNGVDGLSLGPSNFGETKNGVWIPKAPTVSEYGNHGFRLQYLQAGVGSAGTGTIGADTSGKGNHFTSATIAAHDVVMPDSPENNFATYNLTDLRHRAELAEGNLRLQATTYSTSGAGGGNYGFATGSISLPSSGKFYIEGLHRKHVGDGNISSLGVINRNQADTSGNVGNFLQADQSGGEGFDGVQIGLGSGDSSYFVPRNDGNEEYRTTQDDETNHISALAIDIDNGYVYIGFNAGTDNTGSEITWRDFASNDTGSSNVNPTSADSGTGGIARAFSLNDVIISDVGVNGSNNAKSSVTINFGQDSSFAGVTTAQGETDANGIGDFYYTVPSGYLALCTSNLPEVTIGPNSLTQSDDYFNTVLYSGTGSSNAITGVGFQPDWTWIKRRSGDPNAIGNGHNSLYDSTRGVTNEIYSDLTSAEADNNNSLTAFGTDGFTVGSEARVNADGETHVAWNWKANGGTTTTNDASSTSVGSIDSVIQANTTAGFSIVTYTGIASANQTVAHGLQVGGVATVPEIIMFKKRDSTSNWNVIHPARASNDHYMQLNSTSVSINTNTPFAATAPTSTVFTVGANDGDVNTNAQSHVAYCFASVEGYSKMGSYIGNGFADGTLIYLGFRPAWIMTKRTDTANQWQIHDNKRNTSNVVNKFLLANTSAVENTGTGVLVDFLSNGFKIFVNGNSINSGGGTYIFMAFAEAPFKYANAR